MYLKIASSLSRAHAICWAWRRVVGAAKGEGYGATSTSRRASPAVQQNTTKRYWKHALTCQCTNATVCAMDLRGLESIQWRGFSDREIQQLYRKNHGNVRKEKVSRAQQDEVDVPKADQKEDDGKDDHHSCESNIVTKTVENGKDNETEEISDAVLDVAVNEADLAKQYVSSDTE